MGAAPKPRSNQHLRTRKDLLQAAGRLIKTGRKPTMDEVAEAALVSRATAYRYFPTLEALLVEAPLDGAVPEPGEVFASDMTYQNEAQLRLMLANSLMRGAAGVEHATLPQRQNRRTPLIEAALAPSRQRFSREAYENLRAALALIFGTEAMVVFRDVLPINERKARKVKSWAIHALVRAALKDSKT
jgi:AcrR family transcriptional regulator